MAKRMQTGRLIKEAMAQFSVDYQRVEEGKPGYWYRREPRNNSPLTKWFYHIVCFQSSEKCKCFEVDVYTGVLPLWDRQYGRHLLRSSTGLPNLRVGSQSIRVEEIPYYHDGTEIGASRSLGTITQEIKEYALPWFENVEQRANSHPLVIYGYSWILEYFDSIPIDVMDQIDAAFKEANYKPWNVKYPLLTRLKDDLRKHGSQKRVSKWQREEISILALDLFRYAQHLKTTSNMRINSDI